MHMNTTTKSLFLSALTGIFLIPHSASAFESLGKGNGSLIGGDLSDPTDTVELAMNPGEGKTD